MIPRASDLRSGMESLDREEAREPLHMMYLLRRSPQNLNMKMRTLAPQTQKQTQNMVIKEVKLEKPSLNQSMPPESTRSMDEHNCSISVSVAAKDLACSDIEIRKTTSKRLPYSCFISACSVSGCFQGRPKDIDWLAASSLPRALTATRRVRPPPLL